MSKNSKIKFFCVLCKRIYRRKFKRHYTQDELYCKHCQECSLDFAPTEKNKDGKGNPQA